MKPRTYTALLRGINVGGNKPVKMDALRKALESAGFLEVKTLLASGNVLFQSDDSEKNCAEKIKDVLQAELNLDAGVMVRSIDDLSKIAEENPFRNIKVTPDVRLYVTFAAEKLVSKLKLPYPSPNDDFIITHISSREVFSVLTLTNSRSIDLMNLIEKQFGKNVTTRNWNTVLKIANSGKA